MGISPAKGERCLGSSARLLRVGSDEFREGGADLRWRILLDEVPPLDRNLPLIPPGATEVARAAGHYGARIAEDEQLRHVALGEPLAVTIDDCRDVGGLAVDRDLTRPGQRRQPRLAL